MPYETITVKPVTPIIGAEISGVDLRKPLGNQQFQEVHDALMAHQVIFFRDQELTLEQHKAFGRLFGELHIHPNSPGPRGPSGDPADPRRCELEAHRGRALAFRRVVRSGAADGLDPQPEDDPGGRRRHAVRQHVCGVRRAVGADEDVPGGIDRDP